MDRYSGRVKSRRIHLGLGSCGIEATPGTSSVIRFKVGLLLTVEH